MAATSFWLPQITQQDFHAWWLVILRGIHSSRLFCFVLLSHSTKVATGFCLARCSCQGWAPCLSCQVLFSQLGAGQLLSRKHKHSTIRLKPSFLSSTQAKVSRQTLNTHTQLQLNIPGQRGCKNDRNKNNCITR